MTMTPKSNTFLRVLMHGFFLTSLNLFSGSIAFLVLKLSGISINYAASGILAAVTCLGVYFLIHKLMSHIQPSVMKIDHLTMGIAIFVFSLILQPALIHPLTTLFVESEDQPLILLYELILPAVINSACLLMNHFLLKSG
ncbi:MAG: hypothetical protein U5K79_23530 [Cyclobacteriaceae bacterium]|nr:hypothetical protein [Cyclobacteriaceae bacterium]